MNLAFYQKYNQQNCYRECLANHTINKCGCTLLSLPSIVFCHAVMHDSIDSLKYILCKINQKRRIYIILDSAGQNLCHSENITRAIKAEGEICLRNVFHLQSPLI
jgi:transglutaminase/protease-like cytokinesis protein 3